MNEKKEMLDQYVSTDRLIERFREQDHKMLKTEKLAELYYEIEAMLDERDFSFGV